MKLNIIDDDGIIGIVNKANYKSFVHEDWEYDQLMAHFLNQMNAGNIAVWQANNDGGGNWAVSFQEQPSNLIAFREVDQLINVTTGELFLTNYSDLTMAAQYSDQYVPAAHNSDLIINLKNGWYRLTIRQLFNPNNNKDFSSTEINKNASFEIVFKSIAESNKQSIKNIHWFNC